MSVDVTCPECGKGFVLTGDPPSTVFPAHRYPGGFSGRGLALVPDSECPPCPMSGEAIAP